ncbi:putative DNA repair protein BRCA2 [Trypanosoma grayi]|uniref:putative DNA repair protein BRCA2 n=1 Tax=Trypanosoma grayi TaxID=71804 RepID=UPI0004F46BF6|nr:putative DNA repair protein BRCA2 [Trypanosoma grayi]KEG09710.1 putative DNA repair protein BRCA2 [Trypanosoma grayi]
MDETEMNACAHCTFINAPGRIRCGMCRHNIRKRECDASATPSQGRRSTHDRRSTDHEKEAVPTLFSTAAGRPVVVSESSLRAARERLDAVLSLSSSSSSECGAGVSGSIAGAESPSGAAVPPLLAPRRRMFVQPFARTPQIRTVPQTIATSPQEESFRRGPKSLLFDIFVYSSLAMSVLPSIEAIIHGTFAFKRLGCSPELLQILGLSVEDDTVPLLRFHGALLTLGARRTDSTDEWCRQMVKSTLLKLRGLSLRCNPSLSVFSVTHTLLYLCYKYNREFVEGERPSLRVVTEGDVPASSLMVVSVVSLSLEERIAPHTSVGVISDGCYEVKVALDVPLTNLVRENILRCGHKLLVCGAKMLLKNFCSPLECRDNIVLSINYNCTRPADPASALGLYQTKPLLVPAAAIHPLGGLVPSLYGTVERVLPAFFIEQTVSNRGTSNAGGKVVRNLLAQLKSLERAAHEAPALDDTTGNRRLLRVSSLVLTCEKKDCVIVQLWEECGMGCLPESLEECECDFPAEGSTVIIFAVTPSRSRPSHPFQSAKVVYTRGRLDYQQLSPPNGFARLPQRSVSDVDPSTHAGAPLDIGGLFLASATNDIMTTYVVAMLSENDSLSEPSFCVIDVPSWTPVKEITLAMPTVPFTPVIVQNASFIRRADEDLGPDCLHILANEFTRVLQRPAVPSLRAVVSMLERSREKAKATGIIAARAAELLRLRQLSDEARTGVHRFTSDLSGGDLPVAVTPGGPSRVPYYLRGEKRGPIAKGVVIPLSSEQKPGGGIIEEKTSVQSEPRAILPHAVYQHGERSHIFGNIIRMRVVRSFESGRHESIELLADSLAHGAEKAGSATFQDTVVRSSPYFEIDIQFGAVTQQRVSATIRSPVVLSSMLEQRVAIRSVCALAVDEGCVDYVLQRTKMLEEFERTPEESWWWLLSLSCVVTGDSSHPTISTRVLWLESEWRMLLDMVAGGVRDSLFKFSVDSAGVVTRVVFLKGNCCLSDLMRE